MVTVYDDLINFVLESELRILTHDHVHLIDKKQQFLCSPLGHQNKITQFQKGVEIYFTLKPESFQSRRKRTL